MVENQNPSPNRNFIPLAIIIAGVAIAGTIIYINKTGAGANLLAKVPTPSSAPQATLAPTSDGTNATIAEKLAKCLAEKGAKFYGASWCGHCQNQKAMFGNAAQYLPYVECIDSKTNQLIQECQAANVQAFPTWVFPGGKTELGEISLQQLAEYSGCPLN